MAERDRKTILDSLRLFGGTLSQSQAAAKYGVPSGTIGRWTKERKEGRVVELKVAPPPEPQPRARDLAPGGLKAKMTLTEAVSGALGPQIRGDVRTTVGGLTTWLATQASLAASGQKVNMKEVADAARALESVLSRGADLLAFDRSTGGEVAAPAADDLAAAMGVKVPAAGKA